MDLRYTDVARVAATGKLKVARLPIKDSSKVGEGVWGQ